MTKVVNVLKKKKSNKNGISIIIPTYNEEARIIKTLEGLGRHVKIEKEIIVVDDSTDATEKTVKNYARSHKDITFIKNKPKNRGFVKSLQVGVASSKKDVVVFVMADRCDDPHTINRMYQKIMKGFDVVCGSRYMRGGKRLGGSEILGQMSQYLCLFSYLFTGIPTHDATNSFKMYRKQVLDRVKFNFRAETAVSMELLYQTYFDHAKIAEVPTVWRGRLGTRFKLNQRGPKYLKILIWAMENRIRQSLGFSLKKFYI